MKKIENLDLTKCDEVVEFTNLPKGIYICKVVGVEDVIDKEYLKLTFDIVKDQDGNFANYFSEMHKNNPESDWSFAGTTFRSYKESASRFFGAFITAITKSNAGYVWNWDENSLVGKIFIGVFGEEEYLNKEKTEILVSTKLQDIRSVQAFKEGKVTVPDNVKPLSAKQREEYENAKHTHAEFEKAQEVFGDSANITIDDADLPF